MLQLKSAWRDGTTHIRISPLEFMRRLVTNERASEKGDRLLRVGSTHSSYRTADIRPKYLGNGR